MKKLLLSLAIIIAFVPVQAQFTKATLQATGLTCAMCSNAIYKALQKVSFVETVKADIKNSSFSIIFKPGSEVSIDALKDAVEDAGFSIGGLRLTGNLGSLTIHKDQHVKLGNENFHFLNSDGKTITGEQEITVVDKNFVTEKQFKKFSNSTKLNCMQSGKAEACCVKDGINANERVYHIII